MLTRLDDITGLPYGNVAWYKEPEVNRLFASAKAREASFGGSPSWALS